MKTYQILDPTNVIKAGDEIGRYHIALLNRWDAVFPEWIGETAGRTVIRRSVPEPQWQTGPIPEPTELAALVLEGPVFGHIKTFSDEHNGEWYWCKALGYSIGIATMMEEPSDFDLTGRWCIIPLTLPAADGIGTPENANRN